MPRDRLCDFPLIGKWIIIAPILTRPGHVLHTSQAHILEQLAQIESLAPAEQAASLAAFADLKRIQFSCGLTAFPRQVLQLGDSLEILDLSNNAISSLPTDFGRLRSLKILFLSNNHFTELPQVLADCPNLTMIGFKANHISSVPEHALPIQTRWLILTDNKITQLPQSMGELTQLRKCALAGNAIEQLPDPMANCKALELLRISANSIKVLPLWLFQLPRLAWLAFDGNPAVQGDKADVPCTLPLVPMDELNLGQQLGQGASGVIYQAQWQASDTISSKVAVKLFKGAVTSDGYPRDELACSLKVGLHDNIIPVLGHINQPDALGLVMGLVSKAFVNLGLPPSLVTCTRDTFEDKVSFSPPQILLIAQQMANAMAHLHANAVSHGDLYTHNILINAQNKVIFGDFGAATDLNGLSFELKAAMEHIEVRAFGYLVDDLLSQWRYGDEQHARLCSELSQLRDLCLVETPHTRPNFAALMAVLSKLSRLAD